MDPSTVATLKLIETYTYFAIFPISVLEGPIIAVFSGFLVSVGIINIYITTGVLILGDIVGDIAYYSLGRFGEGNIIRRWGHYVGITRDRVAFFKEQFLKHDIKLILFSKTQPAGAAILFAAGVVHMRFWRFFFYSLVGSVPKTALFLATGFYLGASIYNAKEYLGYGAIISTGVAVLLLAFYWGIKFYHRNCKKILTEND